MMRVEASMVMVGRDDGSWFLEGVEEALRALLGVVVLGGVLGGVGLVAVERRFRRTTRTYDALGLGAGERMLWRRAIS